MLTWTLFLWPTFAFARLIIDDPSDVIPPEDWAADNAIIPDYDLPFPEVQPTDLEATHVISGKAADVNHVSWSTSANDTDVVLVREEGELNASFSSFLKSGYSSNLLDASFWGFNAAINVANGSTANLDHINVTVHNGAANVYSYGAGTVVSISNSWLYSSGPVSHGLYASGNGTIYGKNIKHFSGGQRSTAYSGDSPKGYVYIEDSEAHTQGIGSAAFYALGEIHANNVISLSEQAPVLFSDGGQQAYIHNCDCEAGLLAGTVMFSSADRQSGAVLELVDTKITATGKSMPALWFGNVIAEATLKSVELITESGILVIANISQVTQDFDHFAGYEENSSIQPAQVDITVSESDLTGDLVAYNGSSIDITLKEYSTWKGSAYSGYGDASFGVSLDEKSTWTLTADTTVQNLTSSDRSLKNIRSQGYNLHYNASVPKNAWLSGRTINLSGGGVAKSAKA